MSLMARVGSAGTARLCRLSGKTGQHVLNASFRILTHLDLSATNFAVLHNRPVRCRADYSAIFADFELVFALARAALAAVQSAEERERILASCAKPASLCQREVDAAFEVCD